MAIRGSISDIPVTDVLQLLKHGARTGKLEITEEDGRKNILFIEKGKVIYAETDREIPRLGELLVEANIIDEHTKTKYLEEYLKKRKPGVRFGDFLVDRGAIDRQSLTDVVTRKLEAIVYRALSLQEGNFVFYMTEDMPDEDVFLALSLDNIFLQCMEREEDWAGVRKIIPNFNVRFHFSINDFVKMTQNGVRISWVEWNILNLLDGSRTVSDLAERLCQDDMLNLCKTLQDLYNRGFIHIYEQTQTAIPVPAGERKTAEVAGKVGLVQKLIHRIKGL
jgi:hypothetical protein